MSRARNAAASDIPLADLNQPTNAVKANAPYTPGILIAVETDGASVQSDEFTNKSDALLDNSKCRIFGKHTQISYMNGRNMVTKGQTDDQTVLGYTCQGLPFQMVVNGITHQSDRMRATIFNFISTKVTPLIDVYVEKLSDCDTEEKALAIIKELIAAIDKLAKSGSPNPIFSLSLGITYAYHDHLYYAGFGIGDTGLVLQTINLEGTSVKGELKQLAYTTHLSEHGGKDKNTLGSTRYTDLDGAIERNSVFNVSVSPGDEVLGYTFMLPELLEEFDSSEIRGDRVCSSILSARLLDKQSKKNALFDSVKEAVGNIFDDICADAESDQLTQTIHRNTLLSSVTIPTPELRKEIKEKIFRKELRRLEANIETLDDVLKEKASDVYEKVKSISDSEDLTELTRDLAACNTALETPTPVNINALHLRANKPHQFPSIGRMVLSAALILLGVTLSLLSTLLILGGAALLPTGILSTIGVGGIVGGAITAAAGVSLIGTGIGIYASGHRGGALTQLKEQLLEEHPPTLNR